MLCVCVQKSELYADLEGLCYLEDKLAVPSINHMETKFEDTGSIEMGAVQNGTSCHIVVQSGDGKFVWHYVLFRLIRR